MNISMMPTSLIGGQPAGAAKIRRKIDGVDPWDIQGSSLVLPESRTEHLEKASSPSNNKNESRPSIYVLQRDAHITTYQVRVQALRC